MTTLHTAAGTFLADGNAVLGTFRFTVVDLVVVVVAVTVGWGIAATAARRRHRRRTPTGRVLLAVTGRSVSRAAIDAAARIGRADNAVVVPVALVITPYRLPLDCPLPHAVSEALDLIEVIERRLRHAGVVVDARLVQGRTVRHALRRLVVQERFDRLVVPAADAEGEGGLRADDVGWLLAHVIAEVLVLRPGEQLAPASRRLDLVDGGDSVEKRRAA